MGSLSVKRFLRTVALLDSANDNERLTAVRQASFMLREAGLNWTQVMHAGFAHLGVKEPEAQAAPSSTAGWGTRKKFDDLFQQVRTKARAVVAPKNPSGTPVESGFSTLLGEALKGVSNTFASVTKVVPDAKAETVRPSEISGPAIPASIQGVPELIKEVNLNKPMLVFSVVWGNHRYGPMEAHDNLEQINRAIQQRQNIVGQVAPAASALNFPRFKLA